MSLPQTTSSRLEAQRREKFPRTLYNIVVLTLLILLAGAVMTTILLIAVMLSVMFSLSGLDIRISVLENKLDEIRSATVP